MIENYQKIKDYVLALGEFTDTIKLDLQIQLIINEALAYCYREDVPIQMELPLASVIVNEIKTKGLLGLEGNVASYSEGDMSVTFNTSPSTSTQAYYGGKLEGFKLIRGLNNVPR